ncbi:MAG: hypothetical protein J6U54_07935 [Clostridiales bacterium]|nr:hypothetical protein [Clostridiales bacterium]
MAMYENSEALDKEIERLTQKLSTLDPISEEYKAVRISLDALYKLRNDQYKVDTEDLEKREREEAELKHKAEELEVRRQELAAAEKRMEAEAKQKGDELAVRKQEIALAEKKLEAESKQKAEENDTRTYEIQLSEQMHADEIKSQKANRVHDYIVTGVNAVVGIAKLAAVIGFSLMVSEQGYKFEESGTPTSQTFRNGMKNAMDLVRDQFKK